MTNFKNTFIGSFTDKRTVPYNVSKTGTIDTGDTAATGKDVIGHSTLFTTECKVGDWIYVGAQTEVRRIRSISSNTSLQIDEAFTTPLSGEAFVITPNLNLVSISVTAASGATAVIDGVTVPALFDKTWTKSQRERGSIGDYIDPIIVDATSTTVYVTTLK